MLSYKKERHETELEKTFEERKQYLAEQTDVKVGEHLKPKIMKEPETEWQKMVKSKKTEDYYSKIQEVENEQILRETKLREDTHQYAIPGQKVVSNSVTKGMAQNYEETM